MRFEFSANESVGDGKVKSEKNAIFSSSAECERAGIPGTAPEEATDYTARLHPAVWRTAWAPEATGSHRCQSETY